MNYLTKGENMKQWINRSVMLFAALLVAPAVFAGALDIVPMYTDYEGSKKAQKALNELVLSILESNKSGVEKAKEINDTFSGIELCPTYGAKVYSAPKMCKYQMTKTTFEVSPFVEMVNEKIKNPEVKILAKDDPYVHATTGTKVLTVVVPEKALYYAFSVSYEKKYGDPLTLNKENYAKFYNTYKNTAIAEQVEDTMLFIWNHYDKLQDNADLSFVNGGRLYDTVSTAQAIGIKDPYKYISVRFSTKADPAVFAENAKRVYGEMYAKNANALSGTKQKATVFHQIKRIWWNNILYLTDVPNGKDHLWTIKLLSETDSNTKKTWKAWENLVISPVLEEHKGQVAALYLECEKYNRGGSTKLMNCHNIYNQAVKYGYMEKSAAELMDAVSTGLTHPFTGADGIIWPHK